MSARQTAAGFAAIAMFGLAACGNDREAEAETPVAEAEVSTELPAGVVSDQQLEATANAAAQVASSPPPVVLVPPVSTPGGSAGAGANTAGANMAADTNQQQSR